jgi:hypothetical protein
MIVSLRGGRFLPNKAVSAIANEEIASQRTLAMTGGPRTLAMTRDDENSFIPLEAKMLLWHLPEVIEGYTTYPDGSDSTIHYVLPNQPSYRVDREGRLIFNFFQYRNTIQHADGQVGGGMLIFDVEFSVPEADLEKIRLKFQERLDQQHAGSGAPVPQAKIGQIPYLRGSATLQLLDSGGALVEKIQNPGAPALFGKMITPFTVELSPAGATLLEQALQGQGGVVQVSYDVITPVQLPPVTATIWFDAAKFMEFHQHVEIDWSMWGRDEYRETIREQFESSESSGVVIDPGTVTDAKVISTVRDWALTSLEEAVKRMVLTDIEAVPADDREVPDGIDDLWRDISVTKVASFRRTYTEGQVMEWNPAPRGTLPNITTLLDKNGNPYKWEDYASKIDLNNAFFRTLNVNVRANADFETLPLDSVEVKLEYQEGPEHQIGEYSLRSPDDLGKFATFIANDNYKYKYSYQVNYKGESRRYESPVIETDEQFLTANVGEMGILAIDVLPGDLNFTQVRQAQVTLQYEDLASGVDLIEQVFIMDKDHLQHRLVKVIFQEMSQPYRYSVKYFMQDGKEYQTGWKDARSAQLFVNDPFAATRTVSLRGFGDFQNRIDTIFVDLKYIDEINDYSQTRTVAINAGNPFVDWSFPVISEESGKIQFSAVIRLKDGSIEEQPVMETTRNTIMIGDVPREISLFPDLIDFTQVKLVKVTLRYQDPANNIDEVEDIIFKASDASTVRWVFSFKDKTKLGYTWEASYFMVDGSVKKAGPETTEEESLILQMPA